MYGIVHDPGGTAPRLEFNTPALVLCSGISKRCCEVVNVTHLVVAERILAKTGPWIARGKRTPMPPSLTIAAGGRTRVLGGFPRGKTVRLPLGRISSRVFFILSYEDLKKKHKQWRGVMFYRGGTAPGWSLIRYGFAYGCRPRL